MLEVWKDVTGFEEYFSISSLSRVRSKRTGIILAQCLSKTGYKVINTKIGGRSGTSYSIKVHRMLAEAFLEAPPVELIARCSLQGHGRVIVRHLDGDKLNNRLSNLAWGTSKDNYNDFRNSDKFAEFCKNQAFINLKLTLQQAQDIRDSYVKYCKTNGTRALAKKYGVHHSVVSKIINNKRYKKADIVQ